MDAPLQKQEKSTDTGRTVRIKEEVNQEYTKDKDMLKMHILFSLPEKGTAQSAGAVAQVQVLRRESRESRDGVSRRGGVG